MVVRPTTASDAALGPDPAPPGPVRTCVGCRRRAAAAELLRVVVARPATGDSTSANADDEAARVVPDPRRRAPGRGASVHCDPGCVALAERRRSFARALRVAGPLDLSAVREYVSRGSAGSTVPDGTLPPGKQ